MSSLPDFSRREYHRNNSSKSYSDNVVDIDVTVSCDVVWTEMLYGHRSQRVWSASASPSAAILGRVVIAVVRVHSALSVASEWPAVGCAAGVGEGGRCVLCCDPGDRIRWVCVMWMAVVGDTRGWWVRICYKIFQRLFFLEILDADGSLSKIS